jgi:hypothetical protein
VERSLEGDQARIISVVKFPERRSSYRARARRSASPSFRSRLQLERPTPSVIKQTPEMQSEGTSATRDLHRRTPVDFDSFDCTDDFPYPIDGYFDKSGNRVYFLINRPTEKTPATAWERLQNVPATYQCPQAVFSEDSRMIALVADNEVLTACDCRVPLFSTICVRE